MAQNSIAASNGDIRRIGHKGGLNVWPGPDSYRSKSQCLLPTNWQVRVLQPGTKSGSDREGKKAVPFLFVEASQPNTRGAMVRGWVRADMLNPPGPGKAPAGASSSRPVVIVKNETAFSLRLLVEEDGHTLLNAGSMMSKHAQSGKGPREFGFNLSIAGQGGGISAKTGSHSVQGHASAVQYQGQMRNEALDVTVPAGETEKIPVPVAAVRSNTGIAIEVQASVPMDGRMRLIMVEKKLWFAGDVYKVTKAKVQAAINVLVAEEEEESEYDSSEEEDDSEEEVSYNRFRAAKGYIADSSRDLSFRKGDWIGVLDDQPREYSGTRWRLAVHLDTGKMGNVNISYLEH